MSREFLKNSKPPRYADLPFLIDFYDAYLREGSLSRCAAALEMDENALNKKVYHNRDAQYCLKIAEERRKRNGTLSDYVFKSLSKEAKKSWEEIKKMACDRSLIESHFASKSKRLRQELFVHALVCGGFDMSKACRMVAVSRQIIQNWKKDPKFIELLEEIQFHKKNFFEKSLLQLVAEKHPGAVLFVNRTVNADRGYSEKLQIEHSGAVGNGGGFGIDDLDLDIETRRKILEAVRRKREQVRNIKDVDDQGNVIEMPTGGMKEIAFS